MSQPVETLVIGTRGSRLARTQTSTVVSAIQNEFPGLPIDIRIVSTEGDRVRDLPLAAFGDKGVFVRNLEGALLRREIDMAVHSLKDVPAEETVTGVSVCAFTAREDARDVLITRERETLRDLPAGARVGTSSLRRRVQLRSFRDDLVAMDIRGNVDTRLAKLQHGEFDALILAAAGLKRLGLDGQITEFLPVELFTPDAGQGILAIQTREEPSLQEIAKAVDDWAAHQAAIAERACVRSLGADCRSPVGAYATLEGRQMTVVGMAARENEWKVERASVVGDAAQAETLGRELGLRLARALEI